jgi:apolipoprotein N-acyltransferase
LPPLPALQAPTESIVAVQPNVDEARAWTSESSHEFQRRLAYLSLDQALQPGRERPRLIVWPEVPAPLYYDSDFHLREQVAQLARTARVPLLFGEVARNAARQPLNSLQMVNPAGESAGRYDKIHLVPFGEFVPPLFSFVNRITDEAGDFAPGTRRVLFDAGGRRFGAFICYESAFPHFVRQFTRDGAQVLVNASNDGYFGNSAAREQHLLLVRMRAAENGRWILRATNNGVTAAIDPAGGVRQSFPSFEEYSGRLGYAPNRGLTLYARFGDWFVLLCALVSGWLLVLSQVPVYRR